MKRTFTRPGAINLLLGLPLLILCIWVVVSEVQQFQYTASRTDRLAERAGILYANQIHNRLHTQFIELEFIATSLLDNIADPEHLPQGVARSLDLFMTNHPDLYALNIQSADGKDILWSTVPQIRKTIVSPKDFTPIDQRPNFLLGPSKFAKRFGGYILAMRYPVPDEQKHVRFFVGSPYRLDRLMAIHLKSVPFSFVLKDTRTNHILGTWHNGTISFSGNATQAKSVHEARVRGTPLVVEVRCAADLAWKQYLAAAWHRWVMEFGLLLILAAVSLLTRNLLRERTRTNQHLQRMAMIHRMRAEMNQAITESENEHQLFDKICEIGIQEGQFPLMWIGRPPDNKQNRESGELKILAAAGKTDFLNDLPLPMDASNHLGQGLCTQTWHNGTACFLTEASDSPFPENWRKREHEYGIQAAACLILRRNNKPFTILTAYTPESIYLDEFQTQFNDLADDLSRGLDRLDLMWRERLSSAFNRAILDNASAGMMLLHHRTIKFANRRLAEMIGAKDPQELINRPTRSFYAFPDDQTGTLKQIDASFSKGEPVRIEARFRRLDNGEIRWFELTGQALNLPGYDETWMLTDITPYHEALSRQRLLASALAAIQEGVVITDNHQHIIYVNAAFSALTGLNLSDVRHRSLLDILGTSIPKDIKNAIARIQSEGRSFQRQLLISFGNGQELWSLLTINPVIQESGQHSHFVCILRDITALRRINERLEYQSLHDPLTHLLNRRALEKTLDKRVKQAQLSKQRLAVGMLDLDDFKPVNDTYGHEAGDLLLKAVAQRLSNRLRENDVLARLGGDEFVVIIGYLEGDNLAEHLGLVMDRLHVAVESPFDIGPEQQAWVGMSMGVTLYPDDGEESDLLLRRADAALYQAKNHKKMAGSWWRRWTARDTGQGG